MSLGSLVKGAWGGVKDAGAWVGDKFSVGAQEAGFSPNFQATNNTGNGQPNPTPAQRGPASYEVDVPTYGGWSNLGPNESGQALQQTGQMAFKGTTANKPVVNANPAGALRPPTPAYNAATSPVKYGTESVVAEPPPAGAAPSPRQFNQPTSSAGLNGPSAKPWSPLGGTQPIAQQQPGAPIPGLTPGGAGGPGAGAGGADPSKMYRFNGAP